ncbi:PREDICTED: epidermis-specific secreted glycoprotein EP1-like [Fragaria vesca subsp. vesca]|uniref:epidermis-specific secreted glycoprotein EP1-like n=1 Tax=Fragaria vesca subsp. vesca TaxID=101020 RepID=UPI0002C33D08|nr:PREDICTED: epidermis-specific secreted glycoprotein EP1-like [Fragaria vesca subsp. vesca]
MSLFSIFLFSLFAFIAQAQIPANETFKFVNSGEFWPYIVEYDASYRMLDLFASPFQLAFYNTTPDSFTLALRMGLKKSESYYRWVWEANRGNPVGENATFSLGTNGNIVLADGDGRVAWQSNTANKGAVRFKLLRNGNMVLYNSKGKSVWQSFDSPTDTLVASQSLGAGTVSKLVSRASETENKDGPYSLVVEPKGLAMYYNSKNSPKPLLYYRSSKWISVPKGSSLRHITLNAAPVEGGHAYDLTLEFLVGNSTSGGNLILARPKYNSTSTCLRLGIDGNLNLYTYYDKARYGAWETTFTLFDKESGVSENGCQLPEQCGKFGLCESNQCVGCPSSKGVLGWSESCEPEKLSSCGSKSFSYYKIEGVDHFLSKYTSGEALKEPDCSNKCALDCKCLGFFYNRDESRCWIAYELKTLTKVDKPSHVGYIKAPNH